MAKKEHTCTCIQKHYVLREEIKCCQGVNSCTIYCTRRITSKLLGKDFSVYVLIRVYVLVLHRKFELIPIKIRFFYKFLRPVKIIEITHAVVYINTYITHHLPSPLTQPMQHSINYFLSLSWILLY